MNWYVKGCPELSQFFASKGVKLSGEYTNTAYFISEQGNWVGMALVMRDFTKLNKKEITVAEMQKLLKKGK